MSNLSALAWGAPALPSTGSSQSNSLSWGGPGFNSTTTSSSSSSGGNTGTPEGPDNTVPPDGGVPWWLRPSLVNANIRELTQTYNDAAGTRGKPILDPRTGKILGYEGGQPGAFDVSGTVASLQNVLNANYSTGLQNADSAAREAATRAQQQGGQVNSALVRGQGAYDALRQKSEGQAQIGQYTDSAKQAEIQARAGLAQAIGDLRSRYAQQLAAYSRGDEELQLNRDQFNASLGQRGSEFQQQLQQSAQQLQLEGQKIKLGRDQLGVQTPPLGAYYDGRTALGGLSNSPQQQQDQDAYRQYQQFIQSLYGA